MLHTRHEQNNPLTLNPLHEVSISPLNNQEIYGIGLFRLSDYEEISDDKLGRQKQ